MRKLHISIASTLAALLTASAAAAFTAPAVTTEARSEVISVANGCGPGWHRGPYGYCRRNLAPYVHGPYAVYRPYYPENCWIAATAYGPRRVCAW
ncbi:GCG_CRPN prefix-to-repeats domain-containing protein [Bradyrhizobium symbiodeficiens]|uniref:GCG_CRPN prefix-to-repeats domain-containing protein n=1 Tax=Bradyrhizobium symbiodeficiens TaxID=1404367 RepID=UPI001127D5D7|nr:hypothetical protein FJN17_12960 [Bradyrhizobium symbiodeficiens]